MRVPYLLLRCVAKVLVRHAGNLVGFGVAGDFLVDVWTEYSSQQNEKSPHREAELRADLEEIARIPPGEAVDCARAITLEVADYQPEELQQTIVAYTAQIPAMLRRSLSRPSDPSGKTVPPLLTMQAPEDLLPILPPRLPRFRPGDHPLPGNDLELVEPLGFGGFGEVWKAQNRHFQSLPPVALKFCLDPSAKDRLLRHEAQVLDRVQQECTHSGIVRLLRSHLSSEIPCLEYQYVEGGDLAGLMNDWKMLELPPHFVANLVQRLAEIVGFAHRLRPSIVHRDLKPENILVALSESGKYCLSITDFGIGGAAAPVEAQRGAAGPTIASLRLSIANRYFTPLYASPEQRRGLPLDPRDDVYALGVLWYQLLVGDLGREAPRGRRWRQKLEERGMRVSLIDLLADCFDDDADSRPSDAAALSESLTRILDSRPVDDRIREGRALSCIGLHGEALAELVAAVRLEPSSTEAHLELGKCAFERGDLESALRELSHTLELGGMEGPCHHWLGRTRYKQRRGDSGDPSNVEARADAIAQFQHAIVADPEDAESWFWLGEIYTDMGEEYRERALAAYNNATRLTPRCLKYWMSLGDLNRYRLSEIHNVMMAFDAAFRLEPRDGEEAYELAWRLGFVHQYRGLDKTGEAAEHAIEESRRKTVACFEKAVELSSNKSEIFGEYGNFLADIHDYSGAAAAFEQGFRLVPSNSLEFDHWLDLMAFCFFKVGDYKASIKYYDMHYEVGELDRMMVPYGICHFELGEYQKCIEYFSDNCYGHPIEESFWTGRALHASGDHVSALTWLEYADTELKTLRATAEGKTMTFAYVDENALDYWIEQTKQAINNGG